MPHIRLDPISEQWVVIAEDRARRPYEFRQVETRDPQLPCPFCVGNEQQTPAPLVQLPPTAPRRVSTDEALDSPWLARVVPNLYPALGEKARTIRQHHGPYIAMRRPGFQEVIVESPRHVVSISELDDEELDGAFQLYQQRLRELRARPKMRHAILFKNCRAEAGASIEHIHTQIIAFSWLTADLNSRIRRERRWRRKHGCTTMQSVLAFEAESSPRVLEQTENFVAWCPYASRFSYQMWFAPRDPQLDYFELDASARGELARLVRRWITALESAADSPAYNMMLQIAPFRTLQPDHWYIEILPRMSRIAGFEWGTGCWINAVSPETAAQRLVQATSAG